MGHSKGFAALTMANTISIRWNFIIKVLILASVILLFFWMFYPKSYITNYPESGHSSKKRKLGAQMEQQELHIEHQENTFEKAGQKSGLIIKDNKFILEGKPFTILSGTMHYFRVLPDYWEDRMLKMKSAGLNTLETYMAWNLHEEVKGNWNFTYMLDIRKYLELAQKIGLYVILRPGPYICAEWDLGGLPSWLLHDPNMKVRSIYKPFLDFADAYIQKVMEQVTKLQFQNGGPIIAFQVENEYGSYGRDTNYMISIKQMMEKHGVVELLFTSDNAHGLENGAIPNVMLTMNFKKKETGEEMMNRIAKIRPGNPKIVMEFWTGWFDHWMEKHQTWALQDFQDVYQFILQSGCSVNLYMFHGGTNFGFMNGANQWEDRGYQPTVTSYDYDAPLSEAGDKMLKYHAVRDAITKYAPKHAVPESLLEPPSDSEKFKYGIVKSDKMLTWNSLLEPIQPIQLKNVVPMEMLDINYGGGQGYGFINYRKQISKDGMLKLQKPIRDRAIVLLNGEQKAVFYINDQQSPQVEIKGIKGTATLDILVENLGRVNYGNFWLDNQRKGLHGKVTLGGENLEDWKIYPLEFKEDYLKKLKDIPWKDASKQSPCIVKGTFSVDGKPKDTFLNMGGWERGVVFINNFNLGRYWNKGPQKTLYVPAPLLRYGNNDILIFELHKADTEVSFMDRPDLGPKEILKNN